MFPSRELNPPTVDWFDPFSKEFFLDPGGSLTRARAKAPVFFYPPLKLFVITGREDVEEVLANTMVFSSKVLGFSSKTFAQLEVPAQFADRVPAGFYSESLVAMDPPAHTIVRKVANLGFTNKRIAELKVPIEEHAHELIDAFIDDGWCDLMTQYCYPLTMRTLCGLLDLPDRDRPLFSQFAVDFVQIVLDQVQHQAQPIERRERQECWTRFVEGRDYLRRFVVERMEKPRGDLVSTMIDARLEDGRPAMSAEAIVTYLSVLLFAGTDTTANTIGNAVVLLDAHPEQFEEVKREPDLFENAVEETLRLWGTAPAVFRITTACVEIGGITMPIGSLILVGLGGASNDGEHIPFPGKFDIHRPNLKDHLAFGKGRHFCIGAPLARLQARVALQALYRRIPNLRVVPDRIPDYMPLLGLIKRLALQVEW